MHTCANVLAPDGSTSASQVASIHCTQHPQHRSSKPLYTILETSKHAGQEGLCEVRDAMNSTCTIVCCVMIDYAMLHRIALAMLCYDVCVSLKLN